ncbi:Acetyl esterase/lipase [Variovorax sp. YR750]|uniref:GNAT family N-acetyltransferase n=1 Tax=Variovorax sp. YR750 TaxID=1884384 RepID=UPI0008AFE9A5|nr:GNAT family N-acetyltransferase [Variovorax sp. YR750]SEM44997.1 Acetyl esterase/lipase [Variovorax sp. YR750]
MPLHPDLEAFLELATLAEEDGRPPMCDMSPDEARASYDQSTLALDGVGPDLPVEDIALRARDGATLRARLYRGAATGAPLPTLLYFHGGGYVVGGLDSHDALCRALAQRTPCAVLAIDYRLAPEHRFPTAFHDAEDAALWLAAHGGTHGLDTTRVAFAGDSVGGTLATALTLAARDAGRPQPLLQVLLYPCTSIRQDSESHRRYASGHLLEQRTLQWMFGHYLRSEDDRQDWRFAPLAARSLQGIAPAHIVLAEYDPLVDEGKAYAARLHEAGVRTHLEVHEGMVHDFARLSQVVEEADTLRSSLAQVLAEAFRRPADAASTPASIGAWVFHAHPDGHPLEARIDATKLTVGPQAGNEPASRWTLRGQAGTLRLEWPLDADQEPAEAHLLAAIEAAFVRHPECKTLSLQAPLPSLTRLVDAGAISLGAGQSPNVAREGFWQLPRVWQRNPREPFAQRHVMSQGKRHPLRPTKPVGTVYQRHIPWLSQTLTLDTVDIERDLPAFNRWMNDPVVSYFWEEQGDLAKHRAYLDAIAADPRVTGLIGRLDGEAFGYFEVYWAKEDRIAPFYDAGDHDRGWHALIGEARFRGKPFLTAWMPSVSHYLFLDDCRTQRIVIEPRADNHKMIKSLGRCGYAHVKEFDFPHKRAMLGMLLRERFFGEALWIPQGEQPTISPTSAKRAELPTEDTTCKSMT